MRLQIEYMDDDTRGFKTVQLRAKKSLRLPTLLNSLANYVELPVSEIKLLHDGERLWYQGTLGGTSDSHRDSVLC